MIPKIIHYCWFGKGEMPASDKACVETWKKTMPDYEIKRWDETNFDINCCDYSKDAYNAGKWAYVSDCARYMILYEQGGIFLDTDVYVVKRYDDLLIESCFWGVERPNYSIAPGLIIGAEPNHKCIESLKNKYLNTKFINPVLNVNAPTSPVYATEILKEYGYVQENRLQRLDGITVYPYDYFAPMDLVTGLVNCTENTYSIHLYNTSWESDEVRKWHERRYKLNRRFGVRVGRAIYLVWSFPSRCHERIKKTGLKDTLKYTIVRVTKK